MNLRIAWRNLWRNRKRTLITVSLVALSVSLAVFMRSFQEGSYSKMIENAVGEYTGYVQVHQKDYWADKTIDNGLEIENTLINTIESVNDVEGVSLRLESFSLTSHGNNTKGAIIMGIIPEEESLLGLKPRIIKGSYINRNDSSVILGSKLAGYLNLSVGDTLILMGQGHWGHSAIAAYPVKGIVKMPSPELDRQVVFIPLKLTQDYLSFPNGITSIVVKFSDARNTKLITDELNSKLDTTQYRAIAWQEMTPELVQMIQSDRAGGVMMIAILYMIIVFGVFGTVLMMTEERKREFSVMIAIGMQKTKLLGISFYETILMNSIGVIAGIAITIPILIYFNIHPIHITGKEAESFEKMGIEPVMPTVISFKIFLNQILVILSISIIAYVYPLISIIRLRIIKAMKR